MKFITVGIFIMLLVGGALLAVGPQPVYVGELRVTDAHHERLAVSRPNVDETGAPASLQPLPGALRALLPGAEIPFNHTDIARNWIDPNAVYLVTELPFSLGLDDAEPLDEPEAHHVLVLTEDGFEETTPFHGGATVTIGDESFRAVTIRRWAGILSDPDGRPYAVIAVQDGDGAWSPPIMLGTPSEARIDGAIRVQLVWHGSEAEAHSALTLGPPADAPPRWGVLDGDGMQWFESFLPGTGAIRHDGVSVTLVGVQDDDESGVSLLVEIVDGPETRLERIDPQEPHPLVIVERVVPDSRQVVLHGWRDRLVLAAAYEHDALHAETSLALGETWTVPGWDLTLRLEGVLASAIPVREEDSPFFQAVFEDREGHWLFLREGEMERVQDTMVRYLRDETPPEMVYHLVMAQEDVESAFSLEQDTTYRVGPWAFRPGKPDLRAPRTAVIEVDYHQRDWYGRVGVLLATIGLVGLVVTTLTRFSGAA